MKKIAFIFIMFVISFTLNAQARTTIFPDGNAFKEFPFLNQINKEEIPLYEMPSFNLDSIIQEEKELQEVGGFPFRFGYVFNFDYKMEHGKWLRIRR